jgi:glyoxylase-like metal-dependent hydrolase (beta-lactamase superfamily II)
VNPVEALREKVQLSVFADQLFAENCYILRRRDTRRAVIIDPGLQYQGVLSTIERDQLEVSHLLITHGHVDHVAGVPLVKDATRAPVAMHPDDMAIVDWHHFAEMPFIPPGFVPFEIDTPLAGGLVIPFEDLTLQVLHTPGHTEGSVCFVIGLDCFAGDTLFERSIGRTDLPGGNMDKIVVSIRRVLYRLPPDTVVFPGHGPTTTIKAEMLLNPFVPAGPAT